MTRLALMFFALASCGPPPKQPKLSVIQREVFSTSCAFSSCHGSAYSEARLDLRTGKSYAGMVGKPSEHEPTRVLVVPGDPDASYLIDKLYGTPVESAKKHEGHSDVMPPPEYGTLSDEWKAIIREWIARGAPND